MSDTWLAWRRADGLLGIRNHLLVVYTVQCSQQVAHAIAAGEPDAQVVGFHGCTDNAYAVRLLLALVRHPNVGAVLAVGLGCEYVRPDLIADRVRESGRAAAWFRIQEVGGTTASVAHGKGLLAGLRAQAAACPRAAMGIQDLRIGAECGGSDWTSGLAGNPTVGAAFDRLVDAGGAAVVEETLEMVGLRDEMVRRAATPAAAAALAAAYDKVEPYCRSVGQWSVSPGNFAGGLTSIEEKSLGAFRKAGTRPFQGVVRVGQTLPGAGLWLLDSVPDADGVQHGISNPNDTEGIIDLIAAGCHLVCFVTGRGSLIGGPIAPVVKVCANAATIARIGDDLDHDASPILRGEEDYAAGGARLLTRLAAIAAGAPSRAEALGHREYLIPYKHQHGADACRM